MAILNFLAFLVLVALGRFVFLLVAPAVRRCRWCKPESRWCLRCRGNRQHFRLGARTARRVRVALIEAWREEQARREVRRVLAREEARR